MYPSIKSQITEELIYECALSPFICVAGAPKSGKVKVAKLIHERLPHYTLIKTDDYQHYGFKQAMYKILDDVTGMVYNDMPFIVEGTQVPRLLRKGLETQTFIPDLIIKTDCNEDTLRKCYIEDGEPDKIDGALVFARQMDTMMGNYLNESFSLQKPPKVRHIVTSLV